MQVVHIDTCGENLACAHSARNSPTIAKHEIFGPYCCSSIILCVCMCGMACVELQLVDVFLFGRSSSRTRRGRRR